MPAFTTGTITNTGNAASTVVVNISNENLINAANIELVFFAVFGTVATKTPLAHQLFQAPPNAVVIKTFPVTGVTSYEVQFNVTGAVTTDVDITVFGRDANGNLVVDQEILQPDLTTISAITPVP